MTLLRRLLRLFRRPRPSPAPPASGAPAANPDGGTWLPVDEAIAAWNAAYPLLIVEYSVTSKDAPPPGPDWVATTEPVYGWVVNVEPSKPDPLDAIAARFDVRVDAVLRASKSGQ